MDLTIESVILKRVSEPINISVIWKRSNKLMDASVKSVSPLSPEAVFNDGFLMKTKLDWDGQKQLFKRKSSDFFVTVVQNESDVIENFKAGISTIIGQGHTDISLYCNNPLVSRDTLRLYNNQGKKIGYLELTIKTNVADILKKLKTSSVNLEIPKNVCNVKRDGLSASP